MTPRRSFVATSPGWSPCSALIPRGQQRLHIRRTGDAWTATFEAGLGFLTYWVLEPERIVVLLDLTWAG
jgi:hypothetical protein